MQPTKNNVLLEIVTKADQFAQDVKKRSGLIVTNGKTKEGEPNTGVVFAIGKGIEDPEYKIGDSVIFFKQGIFQGFDHDGKKLVSVTDDEIKAICP